ncbi:MAG TPA: TspO/MBR family protein [Pyrinomonadaceae bacterium]|nr:TspO/MBR family protein [Pyrinomonadaceae bacterium]
MKILYAALLASGICILAALLEGLCAGRNVKPFFASLNSPRYSPPLWLWSIIGGVYYIIFWFVLYRLFRLETDSFVRIIALTLIVFMMIVNALTNYIIFRARNLYLSFMVGSAFPVLDIALFICLIRLDDLAAWSMIPYLLYRCYAVWWGYRIWKANEKRS